MDLNSGKSTDNIPAMSVVHSSAFVILGSPLWAVVWYCPWIYLVFPFTYPLYHHHLPTYTHTFISVHLSSLDLQNHIHGKILLILHE